MITTNYYSTYDEHCYLYQLVGIACEGIAAYLYYRQIENLRDNKDSQWHTNTQNAYQVIIIMNWNKLFGTNKEPTHYKKLLSIGELATYTKLQDQEALKLELLKLAHMTTEQFDQYHKQINDYRNKYLMHTYHNPIEQLKAPHPPLDHAFETFKASK